MPSFIQALKKNLPDRSVLDERPPFDGNLSAPFFARGNEIGCLVLHGIGGTPANVRVVADALAAKGYTVLSPVLPGHRETVRAQNASTGEEWHQSVREAYARLVKEGCAQIYALGLSLGGVLCGLLAEEEPLCGLALLCTPIRMSHYLRTARLLSPILQTVRYPETDASGKCWDGNPYQQMYGGFSTRKLNDLAKLSRQLRGNLGKITCPTLIVAGKYDDKVSPSSTAIFKRGAVNAESVEYVRFENSPHGCTYGPEKELVAQKCVEFVSALVDKKASASV